MPHRAILASCLLALAAGAQASTLDPAQESLRRVVEQLATYPAIGDEPVADFRLLADFYARRDFRPAWTDTLKRDRLLELVRAADEEGLEPADYHLDHLESLLAAGAGEPGASTAQTAELDVVLTEALARYAYHLRFGKVDPSEFDATWNFSRTFGDDAPAAQLQSLLDAADLSEAVRPAYWPGDAYQGYRRTLARLRDVRDAGGWPGVPAGPSLKPGMTDDRVPVLRQRLGLGSEPPAGSDPREYDPVLVAAVEDFQRRHALAADGVAGRGTLAALNVPVEARIDQVRVNMERLRWVFRDLGDDFLIVNIAGFRAHLVRDGEIDWSTRVVVGRPYRQTPVFRATMTYLVLNPTWTVPPTILRKDVIPSVRADPGYLAGRHMEIVDAEGRTVDPASVDWSRGVIPHLVRQAPGPWNAMGQVKFMFPNEHFVFVHDTPDRALFGRDERTFSSGCIRIERPIDLAERLLAGQPGWDRAAIDAVVESGKTRTVVLDRPIPVMLLYWTAGFDPDWNVVFYRDVYERDRKVLEALDAPFRFRPPAGYATAGASAP